MSFLDKFTTVDEKIKELIDEQRKTTEHIRVLSQSIFELSQNLGSALSVLATGIQVASASPEINIPLLLSRRFLNVRTVPRVVFDTRTNKWYKFLNDYYHTPAPWTVTAGGSYTSSASKAVGDKDWFMKKLDLYAITDPAGLVKASFYWRGVKYWQFYDAHPTFGSQPVRLHNEHNYIYDWEVNDDQFIIPKNSDTKLVLENEDVANHKIIAVFTFSTIEPITEKEALGYLV